MVTNDTTLSLGVIVLVGGFILTVANFLISRKKDNTKEVENNVKVNLKLDQICGTTTEIRADIISMRNELKDLQKQVIIHEQQLKSIWRYIDKQKKDDNEE